MKGFYKSIAWTAYTRGKKSTDFERAAHSHGTAFWFYAIGIAVIWWLIGWHWALIPAALGVYAAYNAISSAVVQHYLVSLEQQMEAYNRDHPVPAVEGFRNTP